MELNSMTLQVAEHMLLLQSQIEALKEAILSQRNTPSPEQLDRQLFALESRIRNGQKFREKSDGFRLLIQPQDDPARLIQLLHDHVLCTLDIPE